MSTLDSAHAAARNIVAECIDKLAFFDDDVAQHIRVHAEIDGVLSFLDSNQHVIPVDIQLDVLQKLRGASETCIPWCHSSVQTLKLHVADYQRRGGSQPPF